MLESKVQAQLVKKLKANGWLVMKIMACSLPGWPDLQAMRDGRIVFIEVKAKGKKATPLQIARHEQIRVAGFEVKVIDDVYEIIDI